MHAFNLLFGLVFLCIFPSSGLKFDSLLDLPAFLRVFGMRKHSGRVILSTLCNVIRQTKLQFINVHNKQKGNLRRKIPADLNLQIWSRNRGSWTNVWLLQGRYWRRYLFASAAPGVLLVMMEINRTGQAPAIHLHIFAGRGLPNHSNLHFLRTCYPRLIYQHEGLGLCLAQLHAGTLRVHGSCE